MSYNDDDLYSLTVVRGLVPIEGLRDRLRVMLCDLNPKMRGIGSRGMFP